MATHVSTLRAYRVRDGAGLIVERVAARPPGENAWQVAFERHAASSAAREVHWRLDSLTTTLESAETLARLYAAPSNTA